MINSTLELEIEKNQLKNLRVFKSMSGNLAIEKAKVEMRHDVKER